MQTKHNTFTVCIWRALEPKLQKSAKLEDADDNGFVLSTGLLRGQRLHLVEDVHGLQNHAANNLQALGAELVDRVLRSVPEHIVVAVHEVDQVGARDAALHERKVIVRDLVVATEK